jgi:hypothetical protein
MFIDFLRHLKKIICTMAYYEDTTSSLPHRASGNWKMALKFWGKYSSLPNEECSSVIRTVQDTGSSSQSQDTAA